MGFEIYLVVIIACLLYISLSLRLYFPPEVNSDSTLNCVFSPFSLMDCIVMSIFSLLDMVSGTMTLILTTDVRWKRL